MWHSPVFLSSSNSVPKNLIKRFLGIRGSRTFFMTSGQCSSLLARSWLIQSKTNFRTPSSLQEMLRFSEDTSFFMRLAGKERKPGDKEITVISTCKTVTDEKQLKQFMLSSYLSIISSVVNGGIKLS